MNQLAARSNPLLLKERTKELFLATIEARRNELACYSQQPFLRKERTEDPSLGGG